MLGCGDGTTASGLPGRAPLRPDLPHEADVLVVGSGLAGAVVARRVLSRAPAARVVMVEAGRSLTSVPGANIRNLPPQQRLALDDEMRRVSDEPDRRTRPGLRFLLPPALATQMPLAKFESVCDATGRVWGLANLFVAGNGVIPGPTACSPTLTAADLAVLCGDEVLRVLDANEHHTTVGHTDSRPDVIRRVMPERQRGVGRAPGSCRR